VTRAVDFLIVGTPGSGAAELGGLADSLVDVRCARLAGFWSRLPALARRHDFPLAGHGLREAVAWLLREGAWSSPGLALRVEAALRGAADVTPWRLHDALARALAAPARRLGVVSDDALAWWWPLRRVRPTLRWIGVVGDPREIPGHPALPDDPHVLAWTWREDLRCLRLAERELGRARMLVVRRDALVRDPASVRARIAAFLGVPDTARDRPAPAPHGVGDARPPCPEAALRVVEGLCGRAMAREGWPLPALSRPVPAAEGSRAAIRRLREARLAAARYPLAGLAAEAPRVA
jgi:hypothetical protein